MSTVKRRSKKAPTVQPTEVVITNTMEIQLPGAVDTQVTLAAEGPAPQVVKARAKGVKKEKKPVTVVAVVTPQGIEGMFTEPRKPLVVHLPFRSNEIVNEINFTDVHPVYNPEPPPQPVPYEKEGTELYFEIDTKPEVVSTPTPIVAPAAALTVANVDPAVNDVREPFQRIKILACYATKPGEVFQLPMSTDIHCYWCSNKFDNAPCFLPVKEENSIYHVYGNFCTPQCGLAYLLNEHLDSHVRWERMALLHRMYRPASSAGGRLYPAPPRESLISFGGIHTYESFRSIIHKASVRVDIQKPPMISIIGTLDTKPIDFYDSSLQNTLTQGFSVDRFKAWSEQGGALRLKRSKPLKDRDSTLDACINISVIRGESKN
jgi:hypothetical protein